MTKLKRNHRTLEQMIADHKAEIERLENRDAARQEKSSVEGKAFLVAVRSVDKARAVAVEANDPDKVRVLEAAYSILGEHLDAIGVPAPTRRNRRPRGASSVAKR